MPDGSGSRSPKTEAEWRQQLTPGAVSGSPRLRHRARFHRQVLEQARRRDLPLRLLWRTAFWLGNKIRFGNRMAEFLCRRRPRRTSANTPTPVMAWLAPKRAVPAAMRIWATYFRMVPGRPAALLHELGVARLQAEEINAKKKTKMERRAGLDGRCPVPPSSFLNSDLEFNFVQLRVARGSGHCLGRSCLFCACSCVF
jgi:hypothetical protein